MKKYLGRERIGLSLEEWRCANKGRQKERGIKALKAHRANAKLAGGKAEIEAYLRRREALAKQAQGEQE